MSCHCCYTYRQDGIHVMTFTQASRDAVDEWVRCLDLVHSYREPSPKLLLDFTKSGLPPINYFLSRLTHWQRRNPRARVGYYAIVYPGRGMMLNLLQTVTRLLGQRIKGHTRYFQAQYREEALQWLNEHQPDVAFT